ncbi:MAG: phage tail tape measure protein [Reyranella sp.]|uniref:phage tail tape measure protein n=1 Tax=Reyranella sp. TaxID=1929291 RepID=UPI0025CDB33F|nr:phage tail tape measure protein [Reyranella sp.]MBR2813478.1 phage tail tape measure protein [Reyranella sp.]
MAVGFSVFTKITGEDGLSSVFRKVGESARSAFRPVQAFNSAIASPSSSALGRVGVAVDSVAGKFRAGLGSISSWLPALGAIGAGLSLGGLISMTRSAADGFDGAATSAEKLGVSMSWLGGVRYGARQTNVEAEALEKGLIKLKKAMYDAGTGKNKDVVALFAAMHINLRNAKGQVKGLEESLDDIAEAFSKNEDEQEKNAAAMVLFGKAGSDLLPFLNKGRDGIRQWREENARFKATTKEQAQSLGELDTAYKQLDKAGSGLSQRISVALAPSLVRVVRWTTDWVVANREFIGLYFDRKVAAIGRAFDLVSSAIDKVLAVPLVAEWLKGVDVGTAFDVALGALGLTMAGPLFAAISVVTKAVWAMNVALLTNPFVLLAAAIAGAAYAIYANWGPISAWFGAQMDEINAAFDRGLGSGLWEAFLRLNPVTLIANALNGLSKWLFDFDLFAAGQRLIQRLIDGIKSLLPDFNALWAPIDRAMSWVGDRVSAGAAGLNAGYAAGNMPGDFNPAMTLPAVPSPGSAAGLAGAGVQQRARIEAEIRVKADPGTTATVQAERQGVDQLDVGRSMTAY